MAARQGFRYTLGHSALVVGVLALLIAAVAMGLRGDYGYLASLLFVESLCGVCILAYNVRLSRWMWLAILGYAVPTLLSFVSIWVWTIRGPLQSPFVITTVFNSMRAVASALYIAGLALTFQDIRRRIDAAGQGTGIQESPAAAHTGSGNRSD